jgi:hypothetical protein
VKLEFWKGLEVYLEIRNVWRVYVQKGRGENVIWTKFKGLDVKWGLILKFI